MSSGSSGSNSGSFASDAPSSGAAALSAADRAALNLLEAAWLTKVSNFMFARIPQLTDCDEIKLGQNPAGVASGAVAFDINVEGGALPQPGASTRFFGTSIVQLPKTGKFGFAGKVKMTVPTAGKIYQLALSNAANAHVYGMECNFATDATHFSLRLTGTAATSVGSAVLADAAYHTMILMGDAVNMYMYIDFNVTPAATLAVTNVVDEPLFAAVFGSDANSVQLVRAAVGYIFAP